MTDTERCKSIHPERDKLRCTLPAGHDTHLCPGHGWTTLDRLDGHVLVDTGDLAEVLLVASVLVMPGTARGAVDRLNAALTEAVQEADQDVRNVIRHLRGLCTICGQAPDAEPCGHAHAINLRGDQ